MKALVFAGAAIADYSFCGQYMDEGDLVICCDSGCAMRRRWGYARIISWGI